MATYESYKDSGVKWLGQIPSHWEVKKLRAFFSEVCESNSALKVHNQLQFKYGTIVPKPDTGVDDAVLKTISKYTVVNPGDIIINGLNLNYDFISFRVGKVNEQGVITSAYIAMRPNNGLSPKFYEYMLKAMDAKKVFHGFGTGIRATLSFKELKHKLLPLVPRNEQEAIVAYLDKVTGVIDRAIEAQQKMIDALNERKQIIITRAVTRGLNSDAPLRDSGIDWLGQIPEHWKVSAFRRYIDILTDYTSNGSFADLAANVTYLDEPNYSRLIRLTDLRLGLNNKGVWIDKSSHNFLKNSELFGGELLMACVGAYAGYTCIMPNIEGKASLAPNMFLIKTKKALNTYFAKYYLDSIFDKIQNIAISSAQPKLNKQDVRSIAILVSSLQEQEEIVNYIDMAMKNINVQLSMCERMISLLQERKQIIINEVVTGKTKVI